MTAKPAVPSANTEEMSLGRELSEAFTHNRGILIARALASARIAATEAERKRCADKANGFPARQHGNLPVDPVECAEQVASEIAKAISRSE